MQLGSSTHIPDGLLAANLLLNEKPRHGLRTSKNTLHPGFWTTQSSTALRDSWSVAQGARRMSLSCEFGACGVGPSSLQAQAIPAAVPVVVGITATIYACASNPACRLAIQVGAQALADQVIQMSDNVRQNKQFKEAVRQIGRRCGRPLTKDEERLLHEEITKQGFSLKDIVETGVGMFCPGK
jgi:hypothetical protein